MGTRTNTAKWVESRKRWQVNVQKDGTRKTFTSSIPGRNGQREANAKADAWLEQDLLPSSARVEQLYEEFLEKIRTTTSTGNYQPMAGRWKNKIKPIIGQKPIRRLSDCHLQDVIDRAVGEGYSKKSAQNLRADLRAFLKWCRLHKYTTLSGEYLSIPKGAAVGQRKILQPRHLTILFNVDTTVLRGRRQPDELVNAYRLSVLTGLRPGELLGLRWEDVEEDKICLRRAINVYGEVTRGKNDNALRAVLLSPIACAVLEAQKKMCDHSPGAPVFEITCQQTYRKRWKTYCRVNGLPDFTAYEMRHTFISMAACMPEGHLKQLVGHSASMDTYGVYKHAVNGENDLIRSELQNIFSRYLPDTVAR